MTVLAFVPILRSGHCHHLAAAVCQPCLTELADLIEGTAHLMRLKAELEAQIAAATKRPHWCSGCGLRWNALPGVELCGDCWRKADFAVNVSDREAT